MKFVNIHTHDAPDSEAVTAVVNQYPREFREGLAAYSIGIHPWYIDQNQLEPDLEIIASKLLKNNCLAVGECGLDKRIDTPLDVQIEVLRRQLDLAVEANKPVILHCVAAYQEIIGIKKRKQIEVPMIIHGFSKNTATAKQLLEKGFYLSFGKYLLRNPELSSVFAAVPHDRIFLETDTMSESIEAVYETAARAKGISMGEMQRIIAHNFEQVFRQAAP